MPQSQKNPTGWVFYKTGTTPRTKEWRWHFRARNGKITKASTEGFKRITDCLKNAKASGYRA